MSAIFALASLQLKKHLRSVPRLIGSIAMPTLFLVALGFGLGPVFQQAGEGNYLAFLAPGIISMSILFTAMFNGLEIIRDKEFGVLKATLVAPVSRLEIMLGKALGGAIVAFVQGLIVFIITLFAGFWPGSLLGVIGAFVFMAVVALFFSGLGVALASRINDMQAFPLIMNLLIMPLFFLSGAIFPLDTVSSFLSTVASFNPLAYGVDAIRGALVGTESLYFGFVLDTSVLLGLGVLIFLFGAYQFKRIEI